MAQAKKAQKELSFSKAFSSFSVNDLKKAKAFYQEKLGVDVKEQEEGLKLTFDGGNNVFIYPKDDHKPATFTVLNFPVDDIDTAVVHYKKDHSNNNTGPHSFKETERPHHAQDRTRHPPAGGRHRARSCHP